LAFECTLNHCTFISFIQIADDVFLHSADDKNAVTWLSGVAINHQRGKNRGSPNLKSTAAASRTRDKKTPENFLPAVLDYSFQGQNKQRVR